MRKLFILLIVLMSSLLFGCDHSSNSKNKKEEAKIEDKITGTWYLYEITGNYNGTNGSLMDMMGYTYGSKVIEFHDNKTGEYGETNDLYNFSWETVNSKEIKITLELEGETYSATISFTDSKNIKLVKDDNDYNLIEYYTKSYDNIPNDEENNPSDDSGNSGDDVNTNSDGFVAPDRPLQICVSSESVGFYYDALKRFIHDNNIVDANGNYIQVNVVGVDTGSYVNTFLRDPDDGADIFVTSHDNLGKLLDGEGAIAPITDPALVSQIKYLTEDQLLETIYLSQGGQSQQYYGAPVSKYSLVLYYDKTYFADDAAVSSWEKILAVATSTNKMATAYLGTDGYSYSHWLLARPANETAKSAFGHMGTLKLFERGSAAYNKAWGDDQVAIHKYAQRFTLNVNGRNGAVASDSWLSELQKGSVLTVVGGSWNLNDIQGVLGDNYGVTTLPKFTLTAADAYGKAIAGMEFQSGSFYDVKCFVKKKNSGYEAILDEILRFLSCSAIQYKAYKECGILPASIEVEINATDALAQAQVNQGVSAGIPQPFGYNPEFNPMYYSKGTGAIFLEIHQNTKNAYTSKDAIKLALQKISYIWAHGTYPSSDEDVKNWVNSCGF